MHNYEIKALAKSRHIPMWKVGEAMGISENTICRMLRHDPDPETEKKIIRAIDELSKGGKES